MTVPSPKPTMLRLILKIGTALLLTIYPFLVVFGIDTLGVGGVAIILVGITVIRWHITSTSMTLTEKRLYMMMMTFCVLSMVSQEEFMLYYYPVLMNLFIATIFLISLREEQPLIERLYRLTTKKPLPPIAIVYMRHLTAFWGGILVLNSLVSSYTACCTSPQFWALYNGGIAYGLFAVIMGIEWVVRQHVKKKQDPLMRTTL